VHGSLSPFSGIVQRIVVKRPPCRDNEEGKVKCERKNDGSRNHPGLMGKSWKLLGIEPVNDVVHVGGLHWGVEPCSQIYVAVCRDLPRIEPRVGIFPITVMQQSSYFTPVSLSATVMDYWRWIRDNSRARQSI
jgi:hypothetical protein